MGSCLCSYAICKKKQKAKITVYLDTVESLIKLREPSFGGSAGKESACNAGDTGSIPDLGRSPGKGNSSISAWRIPWTEDPGGLYSIGSQRV